MDSPNGLSSATKHQRGPTSRTLRSAVEVIRTTPIPIFSFDFLLLLPVQVQVNVWIREHPHSDEDKKKQATIINEMETLIKIEKSS
jgi:hypothetical protein